jgi:hypothetical protein
MSAQSDGLAALAGGVCPDARAVVLVLDTIPNLTSPLGSPFSQAFNRDRKDSAVSPSTANRWVK